ncbi:MAG: MOSC domain-containing protein [Campylobacterota bacterium]|nr:MOSC domain-containing protein [Campylobacterota bacterium]
MKKEAAGKVLKLFLAEEGQKGRIAKRKIEVDEGGVCEDKHHGKDLHRSILITSTKSYAMTKENGIGIEHGELGENILVDFNPYSLKVGTRLQVGKTVLEISHGGMICAGLSKVHPKLPKLLKNARGIFAKVIEGGEISGGDDIYVLHSI